MYFTVIFFYFPEEKSYKSNFGNVRVNMLINNIERKPILSVLILRSAEISKLIFNKKEINKKKLKDNQNYNTISHY